VPFIVFEDFNQLAKSVEGFVGHGVFGRREDMPGSIESGFDFVFWDFQRVAEPLNVNSLESLWVRITNHIVQPYPKR
jgi:hypothetical protein